MSSLDNNTNKVGQNNGRIITTPKPNSLGSYLDTGTTSTARTSKTQRDSFNLADADSDTRSLISYFAGTGASNKLAEASGVSLDRLDNSVSSANEAIETEKTITSFIDKVQSKTIPQGQQAVVLRAIKNADSATKNLPAVKALEDFLEAQLPSNVKANAVDDADGSNNEFGILDRLAQVPGLVGNTNPLFELVRNSDDEIVGINFKPGLQPEHDAWYLFDAARRDDKSLETLSLTVIGIATAFTGTGYCGLQFDETSNGNIAKENLGAALSFSLESIGGAKYTGGSGYLSMCMNMITQGLTHAQGVLNLVNSDQADEDGDGTPDPILDANGDPMSQTLTNEHGEELTVTVDLAQDFATEMQRKNQVNGLKTAADMVKGLQKKEDEDSTLYNGISDSVRKSTQETMKAAFGGGGTGGGGGQGG